MRLNIIRVLNDFASYAPKSDFKQFIIDQYCKGNLEMDEVTYCFAKYELRSA